MEESTFDAKHDKNAPYWAAALVFLGILELSKILIDFGKFWKGYLPDMAGPVWTIYYFRDFSHSKQIIHGHVFFTK